MKKILIPLTLVLISTIASAQRGPINQPGMHQYPSSQGQFQQLPVLPRIDRNIQWNVTFETRQQESQVYAFYVQQLQQQGFQERRNGHFERRNERISLDVSQFQGRRYQVRVRSEDRRGNDYGMPMPGNHR
ncbi:hypothetical protein [Deinococcus sp. UYEF24]